MIHWPLLPPLLFSSAGTGRALLGYDMSETQITDVNEILSAGISELTRTQCTALFRTGLKEDKIAAIMELHVEQVKALLNTSPREETNLNNELEFSPAELQKAKMRVMNLVEFGANENVALNASKYVLDTKLITAAEKMKAKAISGQNNILFQINQVTQEAREKSKKIGERLNQKAINI